MERPVRHLRATPLTNVIPPKPQERPWDFHERWPAACVQHHSVVCDLAPSPAPRVTIVVAFIGPRTLGAAMKEISGSIWTDIQGPCGCPVAAA